MTDGADKTAEPAGALWTRDTQIEPRPARGWKGRVRAPARLESRQPAPDRLEPVRLRRRGPRFVDAPVSAEAGGTLDAASSLPAWQRQDAFMPRDPTPRGPIRRRARLGGRPTRARGAPAAAWIAVLREDDGTKEMNPILALEAFVFGGGEGEPTSDWARPPAPARASEPLKPRPSGALRARQRPRNKVIVALPRR